MIMHYYKTSQNNIERCFSGYLPKPVLIQYIFYMYVHIHCVWTKTLLLFLR